MFDRVLAAQPAPEIAEEPAPEEHDVAVLPKALDADAQPEAPVVAAAAEEAVEAAAAGESVEAAHLEEPEVAVHPEESVEAAHPDEPEEAAHPDEAELAAPAPSPAATARPDPGEYHDLARLAATTGDWPAAERCWRQFIAIEPRFWWAHCGLATALREQGHIAEAEAVLLEQQPLLPDDTAIFADYARLAETRQDWREALARWDAVRERFPGQFVGYGGMVTALRALGRTDEVGPLLQDAERQLANVAVNPQQHVSMYHDLARLAEAKRDWSEAERCWRQFVAIEPRFWWAHCGLARALGQQNRIDAAEAVLIAQQEHLPDDPPIFVDYARLAEARLDWAEALVRWEAVRARFVDLDVGHTGVSTCLLELGRDDEAAAVLDADEARVPNEERDLMLHFESLGGAFYGCEFGLVQRQYGAEPLGLLRWAFLQPDQLAMALHAKFEGVGLPEYTTFIPSELKGGDYSTTDSRFFMHAHTFIPTTQEITQREQHTIHKRLQFLAQKMVKDLRTGDKIFVYRVAERRLSEEEIASILEGVRQFGDSWLLYVTVEELGKPNGTVELLEPGLMIGYIDHFFTGAINTSQEVAFESWLALCRRAYEIWLGQRVGRALQFSQGSIVAHKG